DGPPRRRRGPPHRREDGDGADGLGRLLRPELPRLVRRLLPGGGAGGGPPRHTRPAHERVLRWLRGRPHLRSRRTPLDRHVPEHRRCPSAPRRLCPTWTGCRPCSQRAASSPTASPPAWTTTPRGRPSPTRTPTPARGPTSATPSDSSPLPPTRPATRSARPLERS